MTAAVVATVWHDDNEKALSDSPFVTCSVEFGCPTNGPPFLVGKPIEIAFLLIIS